MTYDARSFREDPGQLHWYTGMFDNADVRQYIRTVLDSESASDVASQPDQFTLTVSIPNESGPLHGWRILQLLIPGRSVGPEFIRVLFPTHVYTALRGCLLEWRAHRSTSAPPMSLHFPSNVPSDLLHQAFSSWMISWCRWIVCPSPAMTFCPFL